jgi:hypothetical protein
MIKIQLRLIESSSDDIDNKICFIEINNKLFSIRKSDWYNHTKYVLNEYVLNKQSLKILKAFDYNGYNSGQLIDCINKTDIIKHIVLEVNGVSCQI